jgi:hypothetical protein
VALPETVGGKRSPADHDVHAAHPDRLRGDPHPHPGRCPRGVRRRGPERTHARGRPAGGVGPATLDRHFPTKQALVVAAFAEQRRACQSAVRDALADPDPWHGFRSLVERICEFRARSRGFADAFATASPEAMDIAADREPESEGV